MSLEPEAEKTREAWVNDMCLGGALEFSATNAASMLSIAISMKRIADFICGGKDHEGTDRMDVVAYIGREIQDVIQGR